MSLYWCNTSKSLYVQFPLSDWCDPINFYLARFLNNIKLLNFIIYSLLFVQHGNHTKAGKKFIHSKVIVLYTCIGYSLFIIYYILLKAIQYPHNTKKRPLWPTGHSHRGLYKKYKWIMEERVPSVGNIIGPLEELIAVYLCIYVSECTY